MFKKILYQLFFLLFVLLKTGIAQIKQYKILSPDKNTEMKIVLDQKGFLMYNVSFYNKPIITNSTLGIIANNSAIGENTSIQNNVQRSNKETFAWPLGENDSIENNYNELKLMCQSSAIKFNLIARLFNGSVAFRYEIPEQTTSQINNITKENTTFNLTQPFTIYQYNQETIFTPTTIDSFNKTCDFPATLISKDVFISIGEAENNKYTKAELKKGDVENSLAVFFPRDTAVATTGDYFTPWRTISLSKTAIGLHDCSQLNLKLNPPPNDVPAWIKPGKLIRSQLNTQSGLDCIDFAAKHNFQYIMFDAGWYGAEFRTTSDPTQVIPDIDMQKVIQHGKEKGIGVILYVNYVGLRTKIDTILPLFKKWGVAGMKFGFVDGLTQKGIIWLAQAIKKVNDYGFILDIHDNYKPTGLSRTFPALLTQEGIRGDENSPDGFHTTTLPFTRFLAGPADFTFCFPNPKNTFSKNLKVSKAQQMSLTVIYFSPLQSIFWYGKPLDYTNEDEIEFFKYVPTVWSETHYLAGDIDKNISVARRKGDTWFVGNAAGLEDWKASISFNFLSEKQKYKATIYEDDGNGGVRKKTVNLKKGDSFPINIKAKEGQAMIIKPI